MTYHAKLYERITDMLDNDVHSHCSYDVYVDLHDLVTELYQFVELEDELTELAEKRSV